MLLNNNNISVEFDFGDHWREAVGQSSYYSLQTGKRAGIVLILETIKDRKYWIRLNTTIEHFNLPIDTWVHFKLPLFPLGCFTLPILISPICNIKKRKPFFFMYLIYHILALPILVHKLFRVF